MGDRVGAAKECGVRKKHMAQGQENEKWEGSRRRKFEAFSD